MHPNESSLDKARRQVAEAQARVDAQTARIAELSHNGADTRQAEIELSMLLEALELKRLYLALEEERARNGRP